MFVDQNTTQPFNAFDNAVINSDTVTTGNIIDTQGAHDVNFFIKVEDYTAGDLTIEILESSDSGMSGATVIPADCVDGNGYGDVLNGASDPALVTGQFIAIHIQRTSNERYVQLQLTSASGANFELNSTGVFGVLDFSEPSDKNPVS